jgi:hypothetical protein
MAVCVCRSEESKLEEYVKAIADTGAKVRDSCSDVLSVTADRT